MIWRFDISSYPRYVVLYLLFDMKRTRLIQSCIWYLKPCLIFYVFLNYFNDSYLVTSPWQEFINVYYYFLGWKWQFNLDNLETLGYQLLYNMCIYQDIPWSNCLILLQVLQNVTSWDISLEFNMYSHLNPDDRNLYKVKLYSTLFFAA